MHQTASPAGAKTGRLSAGPCSTSSATRCSSCRSSFSLSSAIAAFTDRPSNAGGGGRRLQRSAPSCLLRAASTGSTARCTRLLCSDGCTAPTTASGCRRPLSAMPSIPLDSFAQSLPYHAYMFLVPMPEAAYLALIGFASVWTLLIHDQSAWVAPKFINNAGCHTVHHWHYQYNYGNYFTFWDRIAGTYFNPNGLPARFVAAKYDEQRQQYASGTANDQLDLNSLIVPGTLDISG